MQLLIMLAIVPLCVAFGYAIGAVLDDGSASTRPIAN